MATVEDENAGDASSEVVEFARMDAANVRMTTHSRLPILPATTYNIPKARRSARIVFVRFRRVSQFARNRIPPGERGIDIYLKGNYPYGLFRIA